jgi:hypothetical protein
MKKKIGRMMPIWVKVFFKRGLRDYGVLGLRDYGV